MAIFRELEGALSYRQRTISTARKVNPDMARVFHILALLASNLILPAFAQEAQDAPAPRVRTVLFFSPACPHCHTVITESLPLLVEKYGESLVIVTINTQSAAGQELFREAGRRYGIPPEELGVPLLAVGDRALVGSFQIPDQLPRIVEEGLAAGGIPWPEIGGLRAALVASGLEETEAEPAPTEAEPVPTEARVEDRVEARIAADEAPPEEAADTEPVSVARTPSDEVVPAEEGLAPTEAEVAVEQPAEEIDAVAESEVPIMDLAGAESSTAGLTPWQKFDQDRAGNSIALLTLVGMVISVLAVLLVMFRGASLARWPGWIVALIIVAGLVVAAYLGYVEVTRSEAICGPVGDCNTVQQSPYARLFGLFPIGVLGFFAYAVLGLGWLLRDRWPPPWSAILALELWFLALFGTLFSIYLTVLEPFVIGATCMWCITSAVLMTLLLWAATPAAVDAWGGPGARARRGRVPSGR